MRRSDFRDSTRYATAVASEFAAPVLRLLARVMAQSGPTRPGEWRNGLILGNGHIGDVLYRTCSLDLLKHGLPECKWTYLTTPYAAAVLEGNPAIDTVLPWIDEADAVSISKEHSGEFVKLSFDAALCSDNIEHHRAILTAVKYGIPNRAGFTRKGLSGLVTHPITCGPMSHPAAFRCMIESITATADTQELRPRVFPTVQDEASASEEWIRLDLHNAEFVVVCSPTTRQSVGTYPPELFISILRRVIEQEPRSRIVLSGTAAERPALELVAGELGSRAIVSAGVLSARAYVALLRRCAAFLGTDSGSRHMANAAALPAFFIRNMAVDAVGTGVYCPGEVDIAPAGENLSADRIRRALMTIDHDAVSEALVATARRRGRDRSVNTQR